MDEPNSSGKTALSVRQKRNAPMEMSSKKPAGQIVRPSAVGVKKQRYRDPRFDEKSGKLSTNSFEKEYKFVHDLREKELNDLKQQIREEKDPDRLASLQTLLKKMENQNRSRSDRKITEEKKRERKSIQADRKAAGKKPVFLKKSDESLLQMAAKFEELKKKGKLKTYLEKKRKKNARADARHLPQPQRD